MILQEKKIRKSLS